MKATFVYPTFQLFCRNKYRKKGVDPYLSSPNSSLKNAVVQFLTCYILINSNMHFSGNTASNFFSKKIFHYPLVVW